MHIDVLYIQLENACTLCKIFGRPDIFSKNRALSLSALTVHY